MNTLLLFFSFFFAGLGGGGGAGFCSCRFVLFSFCSCLFLSSASFLSCLFVSCSLLTVLYRWYVHVYNHTICNGSSGVLQ